MATLGTNYPTLSDGMRSCGGTDGELAIVDRLSAENQIIEDMPIYESNTDMGEKFGASTEEPKVFERDLNRGIPSSKGSDKHVFESLTQLEKRSVLDEDEIVDSGKLKEYRAGQLAKTISALGKSMTAKIFYGDVKKNPRSINGLAARLNNNALRGVIDGGGAAAKTTLTSLYLIVWEKERGMYGFYRKGTKAGIDFKDLTPNGPHKLIDPTDPNKAFLGYEDWVKWNLGLALKDPRYVGRLCNIDVDTITDTNLLQLTRRVSNMIENLNVGKAAWYCNRYAIDRIENALDAKGNVNYIQSDPTAVRVRLLHKIPLRLCDGIVGAGQTAETLTGEKYVSFS
jgi:hypothetical protein